MCCRVRSVPNNSGHHQLKVTTGAVGLGGGGGGGGVVIGGVCVFLE